jgi:hypothetical protein
MPTDQEIEEAEKSLDVSRLDMRVTFEMDALELLAIHGCLCLGLRHPHFQGPTRSLILQFVKDAEIKLLEIGLIRPEHIRIIHQVEAEEADKYKDKT